MERIAQVANTSLADHRFYDQRLEEYASQQHHPYSAGTWGPEEADALIETDERQWDNP